MSSDCIFCRIVRGELPSTKVYEDNQVLAFMDIGPIIQGHTLVIPKEHVDPITAATPEQLAQVMAVVQKVAAAQLKGLGANGVNIHQSNGSCAGQVVPHVHFHVIPRFEGDGHRWNWAAKKYDSMDDMKRMADRIKAAL